MSKALFYMLNYGAGNRSRTYDLRITNALLYQLSYTGVAAIFLLFICGINPLFRQGLIQVTLVGLIAVFLRMSAGKSPELCTDL